jgi:L-fuconolactonase
MDIVDSQVHLWAADTPDRPWPPGRAAQAQKPYPIDKEALLFQMDLAGVRRIVIVPPSWEGDRNELALDAAHQYPDRFAVMGRIALEKPESKALVANWKKQPGCSACASPFTPISCARGSPTAPRTGCGRRRRRTTSR